MTENRNGLSVDDRTKLVDGQWYSILLRHPRSHRFARWDGAHRHFVWVGSSEDHLVGLDEVAEVLERVDEPPADSPWC
ncbi:hypothetical protein [Mycolicibacterium chlorophenolicum]|uniref:hypothetical protein n=1 Tax=Mycolicibacterium chlorophenolicum TaxID=37916 RepID=UPI000AF005C2|nr:hypothetical protein [Mycolicibacterium chlorophenolicum]